MQTDKVPDRPLPKLMDELHRLSARLEMEGRYTDAALAWEAANTISDYLAECPWIAEDSGKTANIYIEEIGADPQGYFTLEEAAAFLETDAEQLKLELDSSGYVILNNYRAEYNE